MKQAQESSSPVEWRDPSQVMRLERLGSIHQSRLSFMRILTRRMKRENWQFTRPVFEIDENGVGHAVYTATGPERSYSLVAFSHDLPADQRSDRVIATAWDSTFTLFDGVPKRQDIERLSRNVPLQEAGRVTQSELSVSRANRPELAAPFQAEMLSVFLTRAYVRDLVQHLAQTRGGAQTAQLAPEIARSLGIGNSTGLGMAPFIINHPLLFNNWIQSRETALARVRSVETATVQEVWLFREMLARAVLPASQWHSEHPIQVAKLADLRRDLAKLGSHIADADMTSNRPWDRLFRWGQTTLTTEGQESLAALILEPYGALIDVLGDSMAGNGEPEPIDGSRTLAQLQVDVERQYDWAFSIDWAARENTVRAWYVSAEKLEPRLGERFAEPIEPYELPLSPGRDAARLFADLQGGAGEETVADFLLHHPEHRHMVRRVQWLKTAPFGEIHDNTIGAQMMPIDMMRLKLGVFGATHFDPRSDRWVRITMYGNAPYPEELATRDADFWPYPVLTGGEA